MLALEQKVLELILKYAVNTDVEITGETKLWEDLGYDSVAVMQLLVEVEETFGFECDDLEQCTEAFECVSSFVQFVRERVGCVANQNTTDESH